MRWSSPATVDAISPGGEVLRSFTVDSGMQSFMPRQMHISGNKMAILFWDQSSSEKVMKIVDLEGNETAAYDDLKINRPPKSKPLGEFGCYSASPERFTFVMNDHGGKIYLQETEAR
jgi:hypothetical protein